MRRSLLLAGTLLPMLPSALHAAPGAGGDGVTDRAVRIGRSAGLTGGLASRMKPATEAMQAVFDSVNAAGGVAGRRIELKTLDDGNDPKQAAENTRRLIDDDKVFVMFANSGTAQTQAALAISNARGVPMIGTSSGADSVQAPQPLVFHYKASYGAELRRIAAQLQTMGMVRVALVHSPDATGDEGRTLGEAALLAAGIKPMLVTSTKPDDTTKLMARLAEANAPQAIVLTTLAGPAVAFYKSLVAQPGSQRPQVFAWSIVGVEAIHKEVGEKIRGLVVSQVFPAPHSTRSGLATQYRALMAARKLPDGGYPGLEGYVSARILVEALRRTGRELTRERLVQALETLRLDLGGDIVAFSPRNHVGRSFVELTLVGADGRFLR